MGRFATTHELSTLSFAAWKSSRRHHVVCRTTSRAATPAIAWKDMAGAGNIYRHDYEDVAAQLVWNTVQLALPLDVRICVKQPHGRSRQTPSKTGIDERLALIRG